MATPAHYPQTSSARLIARTIEATWVLWLIGGLYIIAPVLGWVLTGMVAVAVYLGKEELGEGGAGKVVDLLAVRADLGGDEELR